MLIFCWHYVQVMLKIQLVPIYSCGTRDFNDDSQIQTYILPEHPELSDLGGHLQLTIYVVINGFPRSLMPGSFVR